MAVSFPGSPTVGQIHTHNTLMWRWDGTSWESIGENDVAGRIAGGPTRPASPIQGQVFFNNKTSTMELYDVSEGLRVGQEERQFS